MLLSPRPREYWPSGWRWRGGVGGQRRLVPSQAQAAGSLAGTLRAGRQACTATPGPSQRSLS